MKNLATYRGNSRTETIAIPTSLSGYTASGVTGTAIVFTVNQNEDSNDLTGTTIFSVTGTTVNGICTFQITSAQNLLPEYVYFYNISLRNALFYETIEEGSYCILPSLFNQHGSNTGTTTYYPTLTSPFNAFSKTLPLGSLFEIGEVQTINFTAGFNRGSISPAYGTSGSRSGLPSTYNYTGTGLPTTVSSSALSDSQSISNTTLTGIQTWTSSITYLAGEQPLNSKGGNYSSPLASGTTGIQSVSIEGAYPIFATTVNINTQTKQTLVSMTTTTVVYTLKTESGGHKQSFEIPDAWLSAKPLQGIQTWNAFTSAFEYQGGTAGTSLTYWTTSADSQTIQGNSIGYQKYTYNGVDRASVIIKLIF